MPSDGELLSSYDATVCAFAIEQVGIMAKQVRHRLQRWHATGVWNCDFRTLWDEFSYEVQAGPSPFRSAFDAVIDPLAAEVFAARTWVVQSFTTTGAIIAWEQEDLVASGDWAFPVNESVVISAIRRQLESLAIDRSLDRFLN